MLFIKLYFFLIFVAFSLKALQNSLSFIYLYIFFCLNFNATYAIVLNRLLILIYISILQLATIAHYAILII